MRHEVEDLFDFVEKYWNKNLVWYKKDDSIRITRNKKNLFVPCLLFILMWYVLYENSVSAWNFYEWTVSPFFIIGIILFSSYVWFWFIYMKPLVLIDVYGKWIIYNKIRYNFWDIKKIFFKTFIFNNSKSLPHISEQSWYSFFIKLNNNKTIRLVDIKDHDKATEFEEKLKEFFQLK